MEEKESLLLFPFRRPFLASLGITCIYFFLGWLFFTPFFQTSDDMAMNWITRGIVLVDRPSEFLIVVNVLLGIILKNLNLILPHISWYGWGLYSFFFISVWALGAAFFSRERSPWAIYVFSPSGHPFFFIAMPGLNIRFIVSWRFRRVFSSWPIPVGPALSSWD